MTIIFFHKRVYPLKDQAKFHASAGTSALNICVRPPVAETRGQSGPNGRARVNHRQRCRRTALQLPKKATWLFSLKISRTKRAKHKRPLLYPNCHEKNSKTTFDRESPKRESSEDRQIVEETAKVRRFYGKEIRKVLGKSRPFTLQCFKMYIWICRHVAPHIRKTGFRFWFRYIKFYFWEFSAARIELLERAFRDRIRAE